jgi:hypothetical protein
MSIVKDADGAFVFVDASKDDIGLDSAWQWKTKLEAGRPGLPVILLLNKVRKKKGGKGEERKEGMEGGKRKEKGRTGRKG